jgi:hypothetical protein
VKVTAAFEDSFLEEHAGNVARYHQMADRAMVQFIIVRLGLVIGSAALPALTTLTDRYWAIAVSVFVAIFAGLDTQFQWGVEWQHFRSTEMALEAIRRDYLRQQEVIRRGGDAVEQRTAAEANFDSFYRATEQILASESEKFWRFRITKWQTQKPA